MIGYGFGSSLMQGRVPGRRPNPLFYSIHKGRKISKTIFLALILPKYECKNLPNSALDYKMNGSIKSALIGSYLLQESIFIFLI